MWDQSGLGHRQFFGGRAGIDSLNIVGWGLSRVIERVAGKFFFSPLFSSRGIRDDIEEEDDQVSELATVPSCTALSVPKELPRPLLLPSFL